MAIDYNQLNCMLEDALAKETPESLNTWLNEQREDNMTKKVYDTNGWISVKEKLPEEGIYILVHIINRNWSGSKDPKGIFYKVVRLKKGISQMERRELKSKGDKRADIHTSSDEWDNNLLPYCWTEFGMDSYFGQDVDYWQEIKRL